MREVKSLLLLSFLFIIPLFSEAKVKTETKTATKKSSAKIGKKTKKAPSKIALKKIKKRLMEESIRNYPGNCPCPYFLDRAGRRCGKRSAWSRPGGYEPFCYESDIPETVIIKKYQELKKNIRPHSSAF